MPDSTRFDEVLASIGKDSVRITMPIYPLRKTWGWDKVDETTRHYTTRLAEAILSSDDPVALIGEQGTGRRHLLNLFAKNRDHWEEFAQNVPKLYDYSTAPGVAIPPNVQVAALKEFSRLVEGPVRLVCSDYFTASLADSFDIPVILVMNCSEFYTRTYQMEDTERWKIISACEMEYPEKDLMKVLMSSQHQAGAPKYAQTFDTFAARDFIAKMIDLDEQLSPTSYDDEEFIPGPPGLWVRAYRRALARAAFSYDSSPAAVAESILDELREDLLVTPIDPDDREDLAEMLFGDPDASPRPDHETQTRTEYNAPVKFVHPDNLKKKLQENILGQEAAITEVTEALLAPAAGMHDPRKPLQSMLFLGPTGVGKTETALMVAKHALESEMNVIRLDMSEYAESHARSKLLGAPPGYVGFQEGGVLTKAVGANPRSLILLDEVEKAHPEIWDQFLQILDAGRMTDGQGRTHDFRNCIIIMTSNLGSRSLAKTPIGFHESNAVVDRSSAEATVNSAVKEFMRPEFINRIGAQILFDKLSTESFEAIVKREVALVQARLETQGHRLAAPRADIVRELAHRVSPEYGARDVQRIVERYVSRPSAHEILAHSGSDVKLKLKMKKNEISVSSD